MQCQRRVQPENVSPGVTPRDTQPGTGDALPRSNLDWVMARIPSPRVRLARLNHLQRATAHAERHAAGVPLTTGRHCRCVHPTVWPMHLDSTTCPVGSPFGCSQQPGDVHGRGQRELQGCRPRAPTLAVVDQHRLCLPPTSCWWPRTAGAVATRRRRRSRAPSWIRGLTGYPVSPRSHHA